MPKILIRDPASPSRDGWHELFGQSADALNGNISRVMLAYIPQTVPTSACRQPDDWSCGPHAMAEALGQPNGEEARQWLLARGLITSAYGTDYSGIGAYIRSKGYECIYDGQAHDGQMSGAIYDQLVDHLQKGYKAILCMHHPRSNYWTNGGHYICAYGIDSKKETTDYMFKVRQIKVGDHGNDVLLLQRILKAEGIYKGGLDAQFGGQTDAAVRAVQKGRGLKVDGVCGPATWNYILGL